MSIIRPTMPALWRPSYAPLASARLPWEQPGGAAEGGGAAYNPAQESSLIDGLDCSLTHAGPSLVVGNIAGWTSVLGTLGPITGTATYSLTSLVDSKGGTHPSVTMTATQIAWAVGSRLAGKKRVLVTIGGAEANWAVPLQILLEYGTPDYTSADGQFAIPLGLGGTQQTYDVLVNAGGTGRWQAPQFTLPGVYPNVIGVVLDFNASAGTTGTTSRRVDNVEIAGTDVSATSTGGSFANSTLFVGARAGVTLPASYQFQQIWLHNNPDEAAITRIQRYVAAGVGEVAA